MPAQHTNSVPKLPAELAAAKLCEMGVRTKSDFMLLCKGQYDGMRRPADIPADPLTYYNLASYKEFIELGERYLTSHAQVDETSRVLSLEELKFIVKKLGISSRRQWAKAVAENILPGSFPTQPDKYYTDWRGWDDFLSAKSSFLPFKEAREEARKLAKLYDMSRAKDWRNLSRARRRPESLPSNPNEYYGDEWISWEDWYGLVRLQ